MACNIGLWDAISACPHRKQSITRFCLKSLCAFRNRHNRSPAKQMYPSRPVQAFNQAAFDSNYFRSPFLKNIHMHDTASAALTEVASLLSSAVTQAIKVRDRVVVGKLKKREYRRCSEGAC
jgi:hypothetical protein